LEGLEKMNFWNGFHQGQEELGRLEAVDWQYESLYKNWVTTWGREDDECRTPLV
jgi:hypothetical protein